MRYARSTYPDRASLEEFMRYMDRELRKIQNSIGALYNGANEVRNAEPDKPQFGQIVVALGWDPGSGPGVYSYEGTSTASASWVKL